MASYTFDLAVVKYYRESLDEYSTYMPFKIANTKNQTLYAKITITNQGNLNWNFDNNGTAVTSKTYTLDANSVLKFNEKLITSTAPTETQKDQVMIKVEYFKDSNLTQKFGEDTITANIHIYIQNPDYSWTSTQYPNESDIVFEKWTWDNIAKTNVTDGTTFPGALGNAELTVKRSASGSHHYFNVETTAGIIEDYALYFENGDWGDHTIFYPTSAGNPITDKFYATVVQILGRSGHKDREYIHYVYSKTLTANPLDLVKAVLDTEVGIKKLVLYPYLDFVPGIYYQTYCGTYGSTHMHGVMEVVYLFHKLP